MKVVNLVLSAVLILTSISISSEEVKVETNTVFPENSDSVTVPIEVEDNLIYIRCDLNGRGEKTYVFDTGATFNLLDKSFAVSIGIDTTDRKKSESTGAEYIYSECNTIEAGSLIFNNQPFRIMDISQLMMFMGRDVAGILGYDFIKEAVIKIDYENRKMTFYKAETYKYEGKGEKIEMEIVSKWPLIPVTLEQKGCREVKGRIIFDTGSMTSLSLMSGELAKETRVLGFSMGIGGAGAGGRIGRLSKVAFGKTEYKNPIAAFPGVGADMNDADALTKKIYETGLGIAGGELLKRYTLIFDYSRSILIMEKNSLSKERMNSDMSGLTIIALGAPYNKFQIIAVDEKTPGEEAGLKPGDILEKIDGKDCAEMSLSRIRDMFRKNKKSYKINAGSETESREIILKTRPLQ